MALTEKEAQVINNAITDLRNEAKAIAATNRNLATDIANLGKRVQTIQEQMQLIMATYKPPPGDELFELLDDIEESISDIKTVKDKIQKTPKKAVE
jgi:chromosome segregation ATPase